MQCDYKFSIRKIVKKILFSLLPLLESPLHGISCNKLWVLVDLESVFIVHSWCSRSLDLQVWSLSVSVASYIFNFRCVFQIRLNLELYCFLLIFLIRKAYFVFLLSYVPYAGYSKVMPPPTFLGAAIALIPSDSSRILAANVASPFQFTSCLLEMPLLGLLCCGLF